jgi:uncharacterized BrkB/YihY/UPF0761 family membrane protein
MPLFSVGGVTVVFMAVLAFLAVLSMVPNRTVRPFIALLVGAYIRSVAVLSGVV